MSAAVLVYPHQLFQHHPALGLDRQVYLIEDPLYFSQYRFHKQKLVLHRASMQAYASLLTRQRYSLTYIEHAEALTTPLADILKRDDIAEVHVADVVDDWLHTKIVRETNAADISVAWYETPQFLTTTKELTSYWAGKKRHLHHTFYAWQRTRFSILMENGKPVGGKWSYDAENRKPIPKTVELPPAYARLPNAYVEEALMYVEKHFAHHYGTTEHFSYATTHDGARQRLQAFLEERLMSFGAYEDAITRRDHTLFHSVLSPYLNIGLLTAQEVLDAVLAYGREHPIPLASLEGFVRQLIGWREYIRMVYVCDGVRMRNQNALAATRSLTAAWWNGTTGILPIDDSIALLRKYAYTHHIVRLMIFGNSMTLLGIRPHDSYRWFMEWYIDAYDWVMVPNVYGMALFADGGSMVTKPYISSSRYLVKMSDYPKGAWCKAWDGLYWNFVKTHATALSKNVRAAFAVSMYSRLSREKQEEHAKTAAQVYSTITA